MGRALNRPGGEPANYGLGKTGLIAVPVSDIDRKVDYCAVPNRNEAVKALSARGVAFEARPYLIARLPDHELWVACFRDPGENPLAFMSEVRPQSSLTVSGVTLPSVGPATEPGGARFEHQGGT